MTNKILYGKGKPRILIPTSAQVTTTISSVTPLTTGYKVNLASASLNNEKIGMMLYSYNSADEETKAKILNYNDDEDWVTVESFDNGLPANTKTAQIKNEAKDLPLCREMRMWFEPIMKPKKILFYNRKKIIGIVGFYVYFELDYSNYITASTLVMLDKIYSDTSVRGSNFIFYPFRDNADLFFACEITGDNIDVTQHKKNQGHKNTIFSFEGVELLSSIQATNYADAAQIIMSDTMIVNP